MSARLRRAALALTLLGSAGGLATAVDATAAQFCTLPIDCPPESAPVEPPPQSDLVDENEDEQAPPSTTTTTAPPKPGAPAASAESPAAATATLLRLLNDERASRGLPQFTARADVNDIAMAWSRQLAADGKLSHNDAYFTTASRQRLGARALGENVAANQTIAAAHEALMNSPHHRDNILDRRFLVVGLGAEFRNGRWWVTENFLQPRSAGATPAAPAAQPAAVERPARRAPTAAEARPAVAPAHAQDPAAAGVIMTAFAPADPEKPDALSAPEATDISADIPGRTPAAVAGLAGVTGSGAALLARIRRRAALRRG